MCIINCSGACQVAILTHIHDDGYIPCTHATRSTREPQPSVRAPDTRTAPTSAYLSNYRYRAHRTYPGDPAGRQSGASITDYIPERWRKIGIGNEVKVVRGPPGAQTVAPRACESTRADLSRRILRTCDPSYQTCAPCYHRYVHREHRNAPSSRTTALCACTRHSNCTYECISKQLSLPRLPSASRRPPVGLRQPPISLPVYICTCTATISAADLTRENCDIRFLPTFACGSNVPIGGLAR
jgi:hypothetical protein